MSEAQFSGVVREGRFLPDLDHWAIWQREHEGKRIILTADLERTVRTVRQNRSHFGLVVKPFQELWSAGRVALNLPPYTKYETHSTLVQVLLGSEPGPLAGSVLAVPTRDKDTKVFSKFFDDCRALAWDQYQMRIPEPGERMTPVPKPVRVKKAKKRVRRQKKTSRAKLAREADRLWSLVVRKKGRCELCGSTERLQGAHGFSRRYRGTRWLPINGWCLDSGCHVRMTHDPLLWEDFLKEQWGHDVYYNLRDLAQRKADPDFPAIIASLEAELKA